ncbi:MAG: class I SAM-dependent methyltransferase [Anaerolineae bacterium]|nr:class I SAM-dependent methyltransferase [Anaerolineae bacterium]
MPRRPANPITALLTAAAILAPGERVLLLHSDDPELARWAMGAVQPGGRVVALHASHRALTALSRLPGLEVAESVYPDPAAHGPADTALIAIPKGRDAARGLLWAAAQALRPGGQMFLAGPNDGGAKSTLKDAAELLGSAPVLAYKSSHRVALAIRPESLVLPPGWDSGEPQTRTITRPEGAYTVITLPGVFSWDHLDDGTALLLDHLGARPGLDVLDIGCGYGIIGMAAARAGARVTLVDDDLLAVRCARASVEANGLADRCTVLPSDVTSALTGQQFDLALSNPPFHRGTDVSTAVAHRFIHEAADVLRPGGRLRIVANRFLPYDRTLQDVFGSARIVADTSRYAVWEAVRGTTKASYIEDARGG